MTPGSTERQQEDVETLLIRFTSTLSSPSRSMRLLTTMMRTMMREERAGAIVARLSFHWCRKTGGHDETRVWDILALGSLCTGSNRGRRSKDQWIKASSSTISALPDPNRSSTWGKSRRDSVWRRGLISLFRLPTMRDMRRNSFCEPSPRHQRLLKRNSCRLHSSYTFYILGCS